MRRLRALIVGAGLMGRWHLDAARRAGAQLVGVVDRDESRARALAGRLPARTALAGALADCPEVVHVCTPLSTHLDLCQEALAAGCHVVVEKPVTPTAAEAVTLTEAARAADRKLIPVHQFVFQRGIQEIRARWSEFGVIRELEFATASAGAGSSADRDAVAAEIVPHALSLARRLLGVAVGELDWQLQRPAPGEWRFSSRTAQGAGISGMISLSARPTFASLRVLGERASAAADLFHGFATFERGHASRQYKMIRPLVVGLGGTVVSAANLLRRAVRGERAYPGLRTLCAHAYAAIRNEAPPPFADDEIADVAEARDRLVHLALAGRPSVSA